jgi:hypothetical protein
LEQIQPDIVSIQEIKMNKEQANLFLRFDGYKVYYKPRSTGDPECGGGTAVVVKETVDHSQITNLDKDPDHVGIKVETADYRFNLISLYSPSNSLQKETVFKYKKYGPNLFLVGDLNSKTPSLGCRALVSDSNGKVLEEILSTDSELVVLNDESPTYFRFKSDYTEILDLFICPPNIANSMLNFEVLVEHRMSSDHAPIMCTLGLKKNFRLEIKPSEPKFNFNKADWIEYGHVLDELIDQIGFDDDPERISPFLDEIFADLVVRAADQSVPKIHFDQSKSYPPHIISLIKERREVRRDRKKLTFENKPILSTEYNRLTSLIKKSIKEYTEWKWSLFLGKLGPQPPSSSIFWKIINRARSPKRTSSIPNLVVGDRIYSSDEEKANLFRSILGETFTDSGPSTDFESTIYNYVEEFVSNFDYSDENFWKVSFVEMVEVIKSLKTDSSPGEDGVHNRFLKNLSSKGLDLLLKMINLSLVVGLPKSWKSAVVTMIPKKESNSNNPTEYRPISLLSCIGKLAERIIKNRLYFFLETNNLLSPAQSGFRNCRGTGDNLLFMTQKIQESLNRGKKVCGIYFDISKAFDKVWHAGLIYKLIYLKVPTYIIRFIKSFLSDRTFRVKINDFLSDPHAVTCSVPQGSVLGPLLFLIYINDIILARSLNVSYSALFADDLKSIFIFKKPGHVKSIINKYLDSLTSWLSQWRLKMNANKCCYTIFSNGGRGDLEFDLKLNSEFIPYNPNPVFLGITFDESLCFHKHFENLRARALSRLNIIKIFSHKSWHLSRKTLTCIYRALIGSIFDYSFFSVANVSENSLGLVQRIQNRAIRCIYRLDWDSPTKDLFQISGVLFIKERLLQLGVRYLIKAIFNQNAFICPLVSEYIRSWSAIKARGHEMSTPLCFFTSLISLSFACIVFIVMSVFCFFIFYKQI